MNTKGSDSLARGKPARTAPEVSVAERPANQQEGGGSTPTSALFRRQDWWVRPISLSTAQEAIARLHYARGGANTRTYCHGLFRRGEELMDAWCLGVAWWLPGPTKASALATYPENWQGVLHLSRFVIDPSVPKNAASFLLSRSVRMIDRVQWPCLVSYADEWKGHTGIIYKAAGWTYTGPTKPEVKYVRKDGRMVAKRSGRVSRSRAEMEALGCERIGPSVKHKFVQLAGCSPVTPTPVSRSTEERDNG